MFIKKITWSYRNDFHADMECEHCKHIHKLTSWYDDQYYHSKVIPAMTCEKCNKNRNWDIPKIQNKNWTLPV